MRFPPVTLRSHRRSSRPRLLLALLLAALVCVPFAAAGVASAEANQASKDAAASRDVEPETESDAAESADRPAGDRRGTHHAKRDERMREALNVLRDVHPALAQRVEHALDTRPGLAHAMLRRRMPMLHRLAELRKRDRQMYELRIEDLQLARRALILVMHHKASEPGREQRWPDMIREKHTRLPETREETEAALRDTLAKRFEVRARIRRLELARLEDRLRRLEAELEDRTINRDELIDERMQTLLDDRFEPGEFLGEEFRESLRGERRVPVRGTEPENDKPE